MGRNWSKKKKSKKLEYEEAILAVSAKDLLP